MKPAKFLFMFLMLVIVMLFSSSNIATVFADEPPPTPEATPLDEPSDEDEYWPIIKTEKHTRKDPATGQEVIETVVVRQEPPSKDKIVCKDKHKNKGQQLTASATCIVNSYSVTIQSQVSVGSGSYVTGYVKNIADEYCSDIAGCGFYKMTKLQAWWTRTSTNFRVVNAKVTWGCSSICALCTDGTTSYLWQSGYFTPTWNATGLKTVVKTWTLTTMPIMSSMGDYGGYPIGGSDSLVVLPRSQHALSVYTTFYAP